MVLELLMMIYGPGTSGLANTNKDLLTLFSRVYNKNNLNVLFSLKDVQNLC